MMRKRRPQGARPPSHTPRLRESAETMNPQPTRTPRRRLKPTNCLAPRQMHSLRKVRAYENRYHRYPLPSRRGTMRWDTDRSRIPRGGIATDTSPRLCPIPSPASQADGQSRPTSDRNLRLKTVLSQRDLCKSYTATCLGSARGTAWAERATSPHPWTTAHAIAGSGSLGTKPRRPRASRTSRHIGNTDYATSRRTASTLQP